MQDTSMGQSDQIQITLSEKRAQLRARRQKVLAGGQEMLDSVSRRRDRRGSAEFLASMRDALNPDTVGPALAGLFLWAVAERDAGLLKTLLPYVLGKPEESGVSSNSSVDLLMEVLRSGANQPLIVSDLSKYDERGEEDEDSQFQDA